MQGSVLCWSAGFPSSPRQWGHGLCFGVTHATKNLRTIRLIVASSVSTGTRINKCFKDRFSRREADRLVEERRVIVNGRPVQSPAFRVFPGDVVELDGSVVEWQILADIDLTESQDPDALQSKLVYLKYWKPKGVVCTTDSRVRRNIVSEIGNKIGASRIFQVGRLDQDSTGLILLTNDGRLVERALRSDFHHEKEYIVLSDIRVSEIHLEQLRGGVTIRTSIRRGQGAQKQYTKPTLPCVVERFPGTQLRIVLREGRNRQIRKMLGVLGYTVRAIHRTKFLGIDLDGLKGESSWKILSEEEMVIIRNCLASPAKKTYP